MRRIHLAINSLAYPRVEATSATTLPPELMCTLHPWIDLVGMPLLIRPYAVPGRPVHTAPIVLLFSGSPE
eukprot:SAG31_NODE_659_length_13095_cov_4.439597_3_plen_70_part_00